MILELLLGLNSTLAGLRPNFFLAVAAKGEDAPLNLDFTEHATTTQTSGGSLIRTLMGLAIVLAVIYGLYWFLKRTRKGGGGGRTLGSGIELLSSLPLGPNRTLSLVRAGREVFLLGVTEGAVTPVRAYSETEATQLGLLSLSGFADEAGTQGVGFSGAESSGQAPRQMQAGRSSSGQGGFFSRLLDELRDRTVIR